MPQMAPLSWLMLFIVFCMTFMIFNSMNYYSFTYNIKTYTRPIKKHIINWKW